MSTKLATILTTALVALLLSCGKDQPESGSSNDPKHTTSLSSTPPQGDVVASRGLQWFTDQAKETGLNFVHFNGMSGELYIPEILPPGCALFDYDGDGDLDVFLVQGQMFGPGKTLHDALLPPQEGALPLTSRLYRNELQVSADGSRLLRFTDVTEESGIKVRGYGMGVAAADFDNDGCVDLYVTGFGGVQLFRNSCNGTFSDVTKRSGVADSGWSVSASFFDYDQDGWLDLYVGKYVSYSLDNDDSQCHSAAGARDYCTPQVFRAQQDRLFHNLGNGTFADVSSKALVGGHFGPALGVVAADFNNDGWVDVYVANDGEANLLWLNQRDGTFRDIALLSGSALSAEGNPEGSMGVDAGDFDNDGDEDLFMTHLPDQGNNLYVNDGKGMFEDKSIHSRLGPLSLGYTGFGTAWFDYDNDGWLDLLAVNGAVSIHRGYQNKAFPYDEQKLLFRNLRVGQFEDVTNQAGAVFQLSEVSRGAAFGDIDNDGDTDVLVTNNSGPTRLFINNIGNRNHWLGLRLIGGNTPRDMIGARVAVIRDDGSTRWRRARSDGSYASANDPRVLIGLGTSTAVSHVRVIWPSGRSEAWPGVAADRWVTLKEGTGK